MLLFFLLLLFSFSLEFVWNLSNIYMNVTNCERNDSYDPCSVSDYYLWILSNFFSANEQTRSVKGLFWDGSLSRREKFVLSWCRDTYSGHSGDFLSKLKNREEFEGGLEKGRERGEKKKKKKRVIKHTLKYIYEA